MISVDTLASIKAYYVEIEENGFLWSKTYYIRDLIRHCPPNIHLRAYAVELALSEFDEWPY